MAHFASMLLLSEKVLALSLPSFKPGCARARITSLCERGLDEDAGRYRLTFFTRADAFASSSMKRATSYYHRLSRLAIAHLNLKLPRLNWSTDRQPTSFMSRSISGRRFSNALQRRPDPRPLEHTDPSRTRLRARGKGPQDVSATGTTLPSRSSALVSNKISCR